MRGRKPLPDEVKVSRGTAQKCRMRPNAVKAAIVEDLPPAPEWLGEIGRKEWAVKTAELFRMGILATSDLTLLAALCNEWEVYQNAEAEMRKTGRYFTRRDEEGNVIAANPVPMVKIAKDALDKFSQLSSEFGFSPVARLRIQVAPPEKEDPIMALLN